MLGIKKNLLISLIPNLQLISLYLTCSVSKWSLNSTCSHDLTRVGLMKNISINGISTTIKTLPSFS